MPQPAAAVTSSQLPHVVVLVFKKSGNVKIENKGLWNAMYLPGSDADIALDSNNSHLMNCLMSFSNSGHHLIPRALNCSARAMQSELQLGVLNSFNNFGHVLRNGSSWCANLLLIKKVLF